LQIGERHRRLFNLKTHAQIKNEDEHRFQHNYKFFKKICQVELSTITTPPIPPEIYFFQFQLFLLFYDILLTIMANLIFSRATILLWLKFVL